MVKQPISHGWIIITHYNVAGKLDKHTQHAKTELDSLYYKNERAFPFEQFSGKIKQCIMMINKDPDQVMSECLQVQKFLERLGKAKLQSVKTMICQNYATNFVGACAFFSSVVSSVYGAAQIEYRRNRLRKHKISSVHHGSQDSIWKMFCC